VSKILIIDNDDQLRTSFQRLLEQEGYTVRTAASGESGLAIVKDSPPGMVVLDLHLPGMNGLETFKQIHRIEQKLPVVLMTTFGTTETAIEATKMGAFDYVIKPFDIPQMLTSIRQALGTGRFMLSPVDMDASAGQTIDEATSCASQSAKPHEKTCDDRVRDWIRSLLSAGEQNNLFKNCMDHFGSLLVSEALNMTEGNRSRAAKLLGISRPTLHAKIDKYNTKIHITALKA
jgi:DNA-binding NtrC family response regulator